MMAEPASLGLAVLILVVGARSAPIPFLELSFHCNWRQDLEASESPERRVENQENRSSILEKKSSPIIITATHHVRRPEYIRPSVVGSSSFPTEPSTIFIGSGLLIIRHLFSLISSSNERIRKVG